MYAPTKPSSFRRSSERKVTDPNEQLAIDADRRHQRELQAFEEIGFSASAAAMFVTRTPITDESRVDLEGITYP